MNFNILKAEVFGLLMLLASTTFAQKMSYTGCSDVTSADFTKVDLITSTAHQILEPIKMKIAEDGKIYWVERRGLVRMWNPADNKATTLLDLSKLAYWIPGTDLIPTETIPEGALRVEYGVVGIALDPNFKTNNWIYVNWAVKSKYAYRISRFTLSNNALTGEQPIIEIPFSKEVIFHTAGGMAFDANNNLFIAVGNNTDNNGGVSNRDPDIATNYVNEKNIFGDDQRQTANTNSLIGKILRIHPKPLTGAPITDIGAGKTYDIPDGNLFPVDKFPADKTKPEIYTMGHRNPYTLNVDTFKGWVTWGEVGPDEWTATDSVKSEEHNLVTKPGFMGWPYFVGNNQRYRLNKDPLHPTNTSVNNTGLTDLPPAQPALHPYGHAAATSGPFYRYDGRLPSKTKLPPHFNKKWILSDNSGGNGGYLEFADVNETGDTLGTINRMFRPQFLVEPLDLEIGPDGNLYALEYGYQWWGNDNFTKISRLEYHGPACEVPTLYPGSVGILGHKQLHGNTLNEVMLGFAGNMRVTLPEGTAGLQVFDIKGQMVLEKHGFNKLGGWVDLQNQIKAGVYRVKFLP